MSKRLHDGSLKPVFHGAPELLTLKELVRCYHNLVEDATRAMLRIKAIYRHEPLDALTRSRVTHDTALQHH